LKPKTRLPLVKGKRQIRDRQPIADEEKKERSEQSFYTHFQGKGILEFNWATDLQTSETSETF